MSRYKEELVKYYKDITKAKHHMVPVRFNLTNGSYKDQVIDTDLNNDNNLTYDIDTFIRDTNLPVETYEVYGENHLPNMQYNLVLLFHHYSSEAVGFDPGRGTDYHQTYHLDNSLVYTMDRLPETDKEYNDLAYKIIKLVGLKNLIDNKSVIISNSEFCGEASFIIKASKTDKVKILTKNGEPTELELAYYSNGKLAYNSKGHIGKWKFLGDSYHLDATQNKPYKVFNRLTGNMETEYDISVLFDSKGNSNILSKWNSNNGINYDQVIEKLNEAILGKVKKLKLAKLDTIDWGIGD